MPIRMVEDDPQGNRNRRTSRRSSRASSGGGGLGGGLGNIIGYALPFLLKRPKLLIILIVLGVIGYFAFGKSCAGPNASSLSNLFSTVYFILRNSRIFEYTSKPIDIIIF